MFVGNGCGCCDTSCQSCIDQCELALMRDGVELFRVPLSYTGSPVYLSGDCIASESTGDLNLNGDGYCVGANGADVVECEDNGGVWTECYDSVDLEAQIAVNESNQCEIIETAGLGAIEQPAPCSAYTLQLFCNEFP